MTSVSNLICLAGIKILFEDQNWLVIDKPVGVASQSGDRELKDVVTLLKQQRPDLVEKFLAPVHRLDTNVSGVMVLAKCPEAANSFRKQLSRERVFKQYVGLISKPAQLLFPQSWIHSGVKHKKKLILYSYFEKFIGPVQPCRLTLSEIYFGKHFARVTFQLHSGVFHQIRAQCALMGFPIVGDQKYGSTIDAPRLMLHSQKLEFCLQMPTGSSPQTFCVAPPMVP